VSKLLASWRGQLGHRTVLKMWRWAPLCLIWGIWREPHVRSFEDRETVMLELRNSLHVSNFSEFLGFCSSFPKL
jgi:hypothetical protein